MVDMLDNPFKLIIIITKTFILVNSSNKTKEYPPKVTNESTFNASSTFYVLKLNLMMSHTTSTPPNSPLMKKFKIRMAPKESDVPAYLARKVRC